MSEFDNLKLTFRNASAGFVQDVWQALLHSRNLYSLKDLSPLDHENRCIEVLQHCLRSFDNEKWPSGIADHEAWETLVDMLGRCLNKDDAKKHAFVDRITN